MDIVATAGKIADITLKVLEFYEKIRKVYNNIASKINKYIHEIENVINNILTKSEIWIKTQLKRITTKIQDCVNGLKKRLDDIMKSIETWYDTTITNFKVAFIKAALAKLGQSCTTEEAKAFSSLIPHPELSSLITMPTIDIEIPDVESLMSFPVFDIKELPLLPGTDDEETEQTNN